MITTSSVLLLPEVPSSFCPSFKRCFLAAWPLCTLAESTQCGLFLNKETISSITRILNRSAYWNMSPEHKMKFINSYFSINTEESEVVSRPYIAQIILARIILSKREKRACSS